MYFQVAAKVADAVELLTQAQQQGEESYISSDDTTIDDANDMAEQRNNC